MSNGRYERLASLLSVFLLLEARYLTQNLPVGASEEKSVVSQP